MANYSPNEVVDILDKQKLQTCSPSLYWAIFWLSPSKCSAINIERRTCRNTLHRQRQINRLSNNNNHKLLGLSQFWAWSISITHQYPANQSEILRSTVNRMLQYHLYIQSGSTRLVPWYKDKGMLMCIDKSRDSLANQNYHQVYVIITR